MGPTRRSREEIKTFFAPEFQERFFAREEFEDLPDMVGGGMVQAYYLFRFNHAELEPAELLDQIKATLAKHDVDFQSMLNDAGDAPLDADVSPDLLARIVGPGRLGIVHEIPAPDDVAGIVAAFADKAGQDVRYVDNLLRVFASEQHGKICVTNARCPECDVKFCKRLRYR